MLVARHLFALRSGAVGAVGIKLNAHGVGVEAAEIDSNLEDVLRVFGFDRYFAESQPGPFFIQAAPPSDDLPPQGAFVGGARR